MSIEWKQTANGDIATIGRFRVRVFPDGMWTAYDHYGMRVVIKEGPEFGEPVRLHSIADWNNHGYRTCPSVDEAKAEAVRVMAGGRG